MDGTPAMTKKQWIANGLLLLTAAIWGFAFAFQKIGAEYLGTYSYNGIRFLMGGIVLWPVIALTERRSPVSRETKLRSLKAGLGAGLFLCAASTVQQIGISCTTAGKAGFLTALYVILVPIAGFLFFRQKVGGPVIAAIVLAAAGLYLLSITETFTISRGDLIVLSGAILWTAHILFIDRAGAAASPLRLSSMQFLVTGVISCILAAICETPTLAAVKAALPTLLYGGICSVGIAYTLQVIGQRDAKPAHAAILLSMESLFSVLGGALILHERMGLRGIIGCVLMFAAILLAQKE